MGVLQTLNLAKVTSFRAAGFSSRQTYPMPSHLQPFWNMAAVLVAAITWRLKVVFSLCLLVS